MSHSTYGNLTCEAEQKILMSLNISLHR